MKKCLLAFVLLILPSMCMIAQNNVQYRKGTGQVYDRVGCEEKDGYRIVVLNGKYGIADKVNYFFHSVHLVSFFRS